MINRCRGWKKWITAAAVVFACILVTSTRIARAAELKERNRKAVIARFLNKIAELNNLPEIDQSYVEKVLGTKLRPDPDHSNEFFKFFVANGESGSEDPLIHCVDYRMAVGEPRKKRIFLMVEPSDRVALRASDVISKFGHPSEVQALPPPPGGESSVYVYSNRYGELRFGIMPGKEQRITSVVIDRTQ